MTSPPTRPETTKQYRDYYPGESEWRALGAVDKAANIIRLCSSLPHESILEIGAGEGALLQRLSSLGFGGELYAVDISASGIEAIRKRDLPGLREARTYDGYHLPHPDGSIDLVVLSHVLEHVEHPRALVYEALRVARHVFVEVPLEETLRLPADFKPTPTGHINFYTPHGIRRLLQSCGMTVLEQIITNPSAAVYHYRYGKKGGLQHTIKEAGLRTFPNLATRFWVYHSALVGRRLD